VSDELEPENCHICGMPVEVVSEWSLKGIAMVTTQCLYGHWYGGPKWDVIR